MGSGNERESFSLIEIKSLSSVVCRFLKQRFLILLLYIFEQNTFFLLF